MSGAKRGQAELGWKILNRVGIGFVDVVGWVSALGSMSLVSPYLDQQRCWVRARGESSRTPKKFLVPLFTASQKREYLTLVTIWLAALLAFWSWWLEPGHIIGWGGFVSSSMVLAWVTLFPVYFILMVVRSRVLSPRMRVPRGYRVAMVVTKVPSEPFSLVRQTLEAMLSQHYPHDTWLADEDPSEEAIAWCRKHGVRISTRKGCPAYQRPDWPRRARCKEGNLAYFYDHYGYANYDFVVQLDADHVPTGGYLEEMLRPFADPSVGYVAAPSICDRNAHKSWSARGRLYAEAALHGALQAGHNGGFAPLCFGSHYAVRTVALKQIGGLGPELAEDHSTTLLMNAHGWRGVHAIDAIAHGDGPTTFADMVTQEFQWSRSLVTILLKHMPKYYARLTPRLRFQFAFSQLWYVMFSAMMLLMLVLPLAALLLNKPLANVAYPYFLAHSAPFMVLLVLIAQRLRKFGVLRPYGAKILSWEATFFLFARWPWAFLGTITAVRDWVTGTVSDFRVTPKGIGAAAPLPFRVLAPYAIISIGSALAVILCESNEAPGYYIFALMNCIVYTLLLVVILIKHRQENASAQSGPPPRVSSLAVAAFTILLLILGMGRVPMGLHGIFWTGTPSASFGSALAGPIAGTLQGPASILYGVYDPANSLGDKEEFGLDHIFVQWNVQNRDILETASKTAAARNRILMVTVEPFTYAPNWHDGAEELFSKIVAGDYDTSIKDICATLGRSGVKVLIRWGHEMDDVSGRYPWARADAKDYVAAYRHFVKTCRSETLEAKYVWSPKGTKGVEQYYPGDDYVDFVGFSAYALEAWDLDKRRRASVPDEVVGSRYKRLSGFDKPVMIAELGVSGSADYVENWLRALIPCLKQLPLLQAVVYFNDKEPYTWGDKYGSPDWRVTGALLQALLGADEAN